MTSTSGLSEHLRLVTAITKINSEHLLAMGRRGGAEIELTRALEDMAASGAAGDEGPQILALRHRLAAAEDDLLAMEQERARLNDALLGLGKAG